MNRWQCYLQDDNEFGGEGGVLPFPCPSLAITATQGFIWKRCQGSFGPLMSYLWGPSLSFKGPDFRFSLKGLIKVLLSPQNLWALRARQVKFAGHWPEGPPYFNPCCHVDFTYRVNFKNAIKIIKKKRLFKKKRINTILWFVLKVSGAKGFCFCLFVIFLITTICGSFTWLAHFIPRWHELIQPHILFTDKNRRINLGSYRSQDTQHPLN